MQQVIKSFMRIGTIFSALAILVCAPQVTAQKVEPIRYGDFEQWVTRDIKESAVLGGKRKQVFAVGPEKTIEGAKAYVPEGGTPWASSNVYARVVGITKTSNAVYPDARESGGRCAKLTTKLEHCKAIGLININVLDGDTLAKANENPELYPDLVVRVTGFTAYFATLSPQFRQLVVDRFLHGV